jgi:V/A-type H+-transporting ATPase subunit I
MLRSVRMLGFRVLIPQRFQEKVIASLHETGLVEFRRIRLPQLRKREIQLQPLLSLIARAERIVTELKLHPKILELERGIQFEKILKETEEKVSKLEAKLQPLLKEREELSERRKRLTEEEELVEEISSLGIKPGQVFGTERISVWLGRLEEERLESFLATIQKELGRAVWFARSTRKGRPLFALASLRENAQKVSALLYRFGVEVVQPPEILKEANPLAKIEEELKELSERERKLQDEFKQLSREAENLPALLELLNLFRERLEASSLFGYTEATVVFEGWVPKEKVEKLREILHGSSGGKMIFRTFEPQTEETEEVPIQLRNPKVVRDFELLTEVYGLPRYDEIDPTLFLSITFPLFLALCMGDAGYGVILGVIAFLSPGLFREVITGRLRKIILVGAILSVPVGLLVGGVFGFNPLWINPIKSPVPLLKLAVLLGLFHVVTGFLLSSLKGWWRRDWKEMLDGLAKAIGILGFFGLCFSIVGIGLYEFGINYRFPKVGLFEAFNPTLTSGPFFFRLLFYSGLFLSVFLSSLKEKGFRRISGPVNTVYGITGWVSDVASYSRLMALCMATAIIGFAINYLLGMVYHPISRLPFVVFVPAAIALGIAFIILHMVNPLLGVLGGFVHTLRLHFVEFFSKFYEGGGRGFSPFKVKIGLVRFRW